MYGMSWSILKTIERMLVVAALLLVGGSVASGSDTKILISEALVNPEGSDSGHEWIEIYNRSGEAVDIGGMLIEVAGKGFEKKAEIKKEVELGANSFFLICENEVENCDYYVDKIGMQNGGSATDGIRIIGESSQITDTLLYDQPNSNELVDDSGEIAQDSDCLNIPSGQGFSIGRKSLEDSDVSAADFEIYQFPTPGEKNRKIDIYNVIWISEVNKNDDFVEIFINTESLDLTLFRLFIDDNDIILDNQVSDIGLIVVDGQVSESSCVKLMGPGDITIDKLCLDRLPGGGSMCRVENTGIGEDFQLCEATSGEKNQMYNFQLTNLTEIPDYTPTKSYFGSKFCTFYCNDRDSCIAVDNTSGIELKGNGIVSNNECYKAVLKVEGGQSEIDYLFEKIELQINPIKLQPDLEQSLRIVQAEFIRSSAENSNFMVKLNTQKDNFYLVRGENIDFDLLPSTIYRITGILYPYSKSADGEDKFEILPTDIAKIRAQDANFTLLSKSGKSAGRGFWGGLQGSFLALGLIRLVTYKIF